MKKTGRNRGDLINLINRISRENENGCVRRSTDLGGFRNWQSSCWSTMLRHQGWDRWLRESVDCLVTWCTIRTKEIQNRLSLKLIFVQGEPCLPLSLRLSIHRSPSIGPADPSRPWQRRHLAIGWCGSSSMLRGSLMTWRNGYGWFESPSRSKYAKVWSCMKPTGENWVAIFEYFRCIRWKVFDLVIDVICRTWVSCEIPRPLRNQWLPWSPRQGQGLWGSRNPSFLG